MTQDEARTLFDYDAASGELCLRASRRVIRVNSRAGYRQVMVKGKMHYAHRIIWLWVYGEWPTEVDHANGDKGDNRLDNLRLATRTQNNANARRLRIGKSGFRGVYLDARNPSNPWVAKMTTGKVQRHLGTYPTPELAHAAYRRAVLETYGEFARL